LGDKTGKYPDKYPDRYRARYLLGIFHSRYLPAKFDRKLKLVYSLYPAYLPLGIYLNVLTLSLL